MPVIICPHDPEWATQFAVEAAALAEAFGANALAIEHIGSTAIPDILAKPVIDILVEVADLDAVESTTPRMAALGYQARGAYGIEGRRYFCKSDAGGTRTHHVHVFEAGQAHARRHLAFRDYLRAHPEKAAAYSQLKAELTRAGKLDRKAYQAAKADFVAGLEAEAEAWLASPSRG
jgi:GrpB-like predicted nucleotidyltransferase (UPF0157 family)